jgi:multiple sugar transport system substrate-binding protein
MLRPTRRQFALGTAAAFVPSILGKPAIAQNAREVLSFAAVTFSESGRGEKLKAWVDNFNKSQDKYEVQPLALPFSTFANTIFTQMGGGGGPDIVRFDHIDYYAAIPAERILPLDDLIDTSGLKLTATDQYMKIGGKRYGFTFESSNYMLLSNAALIAGGKPPTDFDGFLATAKASTANGAYGFAYRATMAERPGFWQDLCNFVFGFGGRFSDEKGQLTLTSPEVIAGITAYKAMYESGAIPKGTDAATYRRMFWENKLAMEIDNGGVAGIFYGQAPNLKLLASPAPFPTRYQGLIMAPVTINANTKNKAGAAAFLKWALATQNQTDLQQLLGASNVATTVARPAADLAARPWLADYDGQTPYSIPQLVGGLETKTPELQQIILENTLKVLQAGTDPKRAMADAQKAAMTRVLRK